MKEKLLIMASRAEAAVNRAVKALMKRDDHLARQIKHEDSVIDRLEMEIDETALALRCPPMTLMTPVENAVRHGIDPSEDGGRIEVRVTEAGNRCRVQVIDTGVGLQRAGDGLGTGLSALRERLQLVFGQDARLHVTSLAPRGVRAELEFAARRGL